MEKNEKNDERGLVITASICFIVVGVFYTLQNVFGIDIFSLFREVQLNQVWPVSLIVLGVLILYVYKEIK